MTKYRKKPGRESERLGAPLDVPVLALVLSEGDEVVGLAPYCFRSHATVDSRMVFKRPAGMTFVEAATLPTVNAPAGDGGNKHRRSSRNSGRISRNR